MSDAQLKTIKEAAFSARAKVTWAQVHVQQLETHIKKLTDQDGYVMESQRNPATGYYMLYIGPKDHGWPIESFMHLGDAIHNLNCVMDHLWSGLARAAAPEVETKITFPRHETRENLVNMLANPKSYHAAIKGAFPQAESFAVDTVKAYNGSDNLIWLLNKLDNINKHRRLIASFHVTRFGQKFFARMKSGGGINLGQAAFNNATGKPIVMALGEPFEIEYDVKPTVEICFAEPGLLESKPILTMMTDFTNATNKVIDAFEQTFLISQGVEPTPDGVPG